MYNSSNFFGLAFLYLIMKEYEYYSDFYHYLKMSCCILYQTNVFFFCLRLRVLSKENNGFPVFGKALKSTTVTE